MLTKQRKDAIFNLILNIKDHEEITFKNYTEEEKEYIIERIKNNSGKMFELECNNLKTKFRKRFLL